jgi:hypothetical protein
MGRRAMNELMKKLLVETYAQGAVDVIASIRDGVAALAATGVEKIELDDLEELLKQFENNVGGEGG